MSHLFFKISSFFTLQNKKEIKNDEKTLLLGATAALGGYLAKQYWDKKKAESGSILSEHYQQTNAFNRLHRFKHLREKIRLSLVNLAEKIKRLGDFGDSFKIFQCVMNDEAYSLIIMSKNEAGTMTRLFGEICEALKAKEIWLDKIAQSVGESHKSDLSESKSGESNKSRESSGKSLPAQTKSEITALVDIMQSIYTLVLRGNLLRDNKWRDDKLTEAQNLLNALKLHPSESSAKQN